MLLICLKLPIVVIKSLKLAIERTKMLIEIYKSMKSSYPKRLLHFRHQRSGQVGSKQDSKKQKPSSTNKYVTVSFYFFFFNSIAITSFIQLPVSFMPDSLFM